MKQLSKPTENMGGLLSVWAVPPTDISFGINAVSFMTTDNIIKLYCSLGSISFSEKVTLEKYGIGCENQLNASIPKDC